MRGIFQCKNYLENPPEIRILTEIPVRKSVVCGAQCEKCNLMHYADAIESVKVNNATHQIYEQSNERVCVRLTLLTQITSTKMIKTMMILIFAT